MADNELANETGENRKGNSIPDEIELSQEQIDLYFELWLHWRMTDKKHLLSDLLSEPIEPWDVVFKLENNYQQFLAVLRENTGNNGER